MRLYQFCATRRRKVVNSMRIRFQHTRIRSYGFGCLIKRRELGWEWTLDHQSRVISTVYTLTLACLVGLEVSMILERQERP